LLVLGGYGSAESFLDNYQEKLVLHQWEQARSLWATAPLKTRELMQIDYYRARAEPDKAWRILRKVDPKTIERPLKAYFYFLRGESEYGMGRSDLAWRNLEAMELSPVSPLLDLRVRELTARLYLDKEDTPAVQTLLSSLPEHTLKELFLWRILALSADHDKRWVDAENRWGQISGWAAARQEWRLLADSRLSVARQLLPFRPRSSLEYLQGSLHALAREPADCDPEALRLSLILGYSELIDLFPDELTEMRGTLYEMTKSSRAGWLLAGSAEPLPSHYDRTTILRDALSSAEADSDYLAAAWLSLALVDRIYVRVTNRSEFVDVARRHLEQLGALYPGWTPFRDATLEEVEAKALSFQTETGSMSHHMEGMTAWERGHILLNLVSLSSLDLRGPTELYLDLLEEDLRREAITNPVSPLRAVLGSLHSNLRSYDPDLLDSGRLKEILPYQEFFRDRLLERPEFINQVLRKADPEGRPSEQLALAELLMYLGRHHEARRLLSRLEQQSAEDSAFRLRVLERLFRSLSRTGELSNHDPLLDSLVECMTRQAVDGTDTTVNGLLPSIEVLIVTGRLQSAEHQLDRMLSAAAGDRTKQGHLATSSVYIHRAMVGRLLGEPVENTLALLEQGAQVANEVKIWGETVNLAYRAALLAEIGRTDEFLALYESMPDAFFESTSRLQLQLQKDLLSGLSLSEAKSRQRESWERYSRRLNPELARTLAIKRAKVEVVEAFPVPSVTTLFVESLGPRFLERHRTGRRELSQAEFFRYAGELTREVEGDKAFLLPFQAGYLSILRRKLPPDAVLYHPILLDNRLVKLEVSRDHLVLDEFILSAKEFRSELRELRSLCASPDSSTEALKTLSANLKPVLWGPELDQYRQVWLLAPRPLDGVPWPLLSVPGQSLRWTDGDLAQPEEFEISPMLLVGGHPGLNGSRKEIAELASLFEEASVWRQDTGLDGLVEASRRARVVHISGHGKGFREGDGEIDLGPIQVDLEGLFSFQFQKEPLVVLATCEGGSGYDSERGRSFSLVTPFRAAGASRVLANIWALNDAEALGFFVGFYRMLKGGVTPEGALDQLRDQARRADRHPYYWAGLFLTQGL
jgi:CHAT domain-containing protein